MAYAIEEYQPTQLETQYQHTVIDALLVEEEISMLLVDLVSEISTYQNVEKGDALSARVTRKLAAPLFPLPVRLDDYMHAW